MSTLYLFPPNEEPAEDAEILAGEYALGVMDPGEAAAIRLRADADPALLGAIGAWQARLVPMTEMLAETPPPPELWTRLAAEIGIRQPVPEPPAPEPPSPELVSPEPPAPEAPETAEAKPIPKEDPPPPQMPLLEPLPGPVPAPQAVEPVPEAAEPVAEVLADYAAPPPDLPPPEEALGFTTSLPHIQEQAEPTPLLRTDLATADSPPAAMPSAVTSTAFARLPRPSGWSAAPAPTIATPAKSGLFGRVGFWRATTAASLVLATGIAVFAIVSQPPSTQAVAAIGVANAPAPIYLAEADAKGNVRMTPLAVIAVPNGRDLQLWMIPPGSDTPSSLGVIAAGGQTVSLGGPPAEGTRLVVSMEPRGGAPSGRITGQVLYGGTLANR